jgi:hypothetical protein
MVTIPLSEVQFIAAKLRLKSTTGVDLQLNTGEIHHSGVVVRFSYLNRVLTAEVIQKPFLISTAAVEDRIRSWFDTEEFIPK